MIEAVGTLMMIILSPFLYLFWYVAEALLDYWLHIIYKIYYLLQYFILYSFHDWDHRLNTKPICWINPFSLQKHYRYLDINTLLVYNQKKVFQKNTREFYISKNNVKKIIRKIMLKNWCKFVLLEKWL